MIGYKSNFIFVHVPKTAGQSVSGALKPFTLPLHKRVVQRLGRHAFRRSKYDHYSLYPGGQHATAQEIRSFLGQREFENFYSFAFVRNPWDRMVSTYNFAKRRPKSYRYKFAINSTLDEFVESLPQLKMKQQVEYIFDETGSVMVDKVGRFETLADDFAEICDHIGISVRLPHRNKTNHDDYRRSLSDTSRELIAKHFADDIREFGYTWD